MHFLYPRFLFALLLLVIPVLIHLFNFRRYQKVYFSNVQFLKEIQEQQSSARNLKERLILAMRMLALTFLVLAFARPYFSSKNSAVAGKHQVVSIFVDNSYSMETLNREGSLLDEAKQRAKAIASAYSINDEFQLLTQDFEGKHQRLLSRDEFNDAVDVVKISPQSRNLQQIMSRQQSLLNMSKTAIRSVYLISDFQKNMAINRSVNADTGLNINLVPLKANSLPNVAIDSVQLLSAIHRPGDGEKLVVRLHNYAGETAEKIPLKLSINGVQKALGSYTLAGRAIQYDTLSFSGLKAGWQRAEINLQDNPVTFDNRFYFTFDVKQQMPVLLIDDGTPNPYLKAVFAADPFFSAKRVTDGNVDYASLNIFPIIVLSDVDRIAAGLAQQLNTYVKKGGTLLIFPGNEIDFNSYKTFLQPLHAAFPEKIQTGNFKVNAINLQNPVFKNIFENYPQNPDLPVVKKYYGFNNQARGENLMTLQGEDSFWERFSFGKGKVYLSAVALNEDFSNLPRHALFVPAMFRIALLSGHDQPLFYVLGRDETIELPPVQTTDKQLIKLTQGTITIIPDTRQQEGSTLLYTADQLHNTGLYNITKQDSLIGVVAYNDNRSESDLSYLSIADLKKLIPAAAIVADNGTATLNSTSTETNFGIQLWKLCIILALIFLGLEIILIRYFSTDRKSVSQPV